MLAAKSVSRVAATRQVCVREGAPVLGSLTRAPHHMKSTTFLPWWLQAPRMVVAPARGIRVITRATVVSAVQLLCSQLRPAGAQSRP